LGNEAFFFFRNQFVLLFGEDKPVHGSTASTVWNDVEVIISKALRRVCTMYLDNIRGVATSEDTSE
jgi:hypothetical protein